MMTPDTPSFPLPPLDAAVAIIKSGVELDGGNSVEPAWTEDEDGVLQSVSQSLFLATCSEHSRSTSCTPLDPSERRTHPAHFHLPPP